jgi:hypothetical protein
MPKSAAWAAVSGSTQAPFTIVVAPMARRRRQSATRALDGLLGSCTRKSSQPGAKLSAAMGIAGHCHSYYSQQLMMPIG